MTSKQINPVSVKTRAKKSKKVAIVGGSPTTQMEAPFADESWEIWVLGNQLNCYDGLKVTRTFEIHDDLSDKPDSYPEWLVTYAPRLVVCESFPIKEHKNQRGPIEVYPKKEVEAILGGHFSSSPAYMIGYAVLKGATEIAIYGIDMCVSDHEYFKQRPDMYAWIGYCKGKGIKITLPEKTTLFVSEYDEGLHWGQPRSVGVFSNSSFTKFAAEHREKAQEIKTQIEQLEARINGHLGAAQTYDQLGRVARAIESGVHIQNLDVVTKVGN